MIYHTTVDKILSLIKESGMWFETFEHAPVRTSEEAAKIRPGYSLKQGAKAIIVRVKEKSGVKTFVMLVVPGDQRFDNEKVKTILNAKDIRFATEEEIRELTDGILPGGVPPFGNLFGLRVIVDPMLYINEKIVFNAGDRRFSIAMKSQDYKILMKPLIEAIV